ncbi:MAG: hypothetical protein U0670_07570 [Anaerolineae bacterium]
MSLKRMLLLTMIMAMLLIATAALSVQALSNADITLSGYWTYDSQVLLCSYDDSYLWIDYTVTGNADVNDAPDNVDGAWDDFAIVILDGNGNVIDLDTFSESLGAFEDYESIDPGIDEFSAPLTRPFTMIVYDTPSIIDSVWNDENTYASYDWVIANGVEIARITVDPSFAGPCGDLPLASSAGTCLNAPSGSVVGDMPNRTQAFYSPGNLSPGLFINPGTYWVIGQDASGQFYKIILACQYLWVPVDSMQPSFQSPWTGQPLPTRVVS